MFLTVDSQTISYPIHRYVSALCTIFHSPSSNGSLATVIKPNANKKSSIIAILLYCILQKYQLYEKCVFSNSVTMHHSSPYSKKCGCKEIQTETN
jgi:hypothetical protein